MRRDPLRWDRFRKFYEVLGSVGLAFVVAGTVLRINGGSEIGLPMTLFGAGLWIFGLLGETRYLRAALSLALWRPERLPLIAVVAPTHRAARSTRYLLDRLHYPARVIVCATDEDMRGRVADLIVLVDRDQLPADMLESIEPLRAPRRAAVWEVSDLPSDPERSWPPPPPRPNKRIVRWSRWF